MEPRPACPAPDVWRQIVEGRLSDAAGDHSRHLEGCRSCQAVVDGLTGGGRTWLNIAAELRRPPPPLPPAVRDALGKARASGPQPTPTRPIMAPRIHIERMPHRGSIAVADEGAPAYVLLKLIPSGLNGAARPPALNLALALDVSGSMYEED